jgi:hypothetical protein
MAVGAAINLTTAGVTCEALSRCTERSEPLLVAPELRVGTPGTCEYGHAASNPSQTYPFTGRHRTPLVGLVSSPSSPQNCRSPGRLRSFRPTLRHFESALVALFKAWPNSRRSPVTARHQTLGAKKSLSCQRDERLAAEGSREGTHRHEHIIGGDKDSPPCLQRTPRRRLPATRTKARSLPLELRQPDRPV